MPEAYRELVERLLRDREGYTGDGHGGVGALPEGDRSTAARPIYKSDLREAILTGEVAVDSALLAAERAEAAALAASQSSPVVMASDMAELLANTNGHPVGTVFLTRRELTVTEAVATGGDYVTAGGTRLRDITPNPVAQREGAFFANSTNPGSITRIANRMFVGDSFHTTGSTTDVVGSTWSWLKDTPSVAGIGGSHWLEAAANMSVTAEYGIAVTGASRILPGATANRTAIGLAGLVWNQGISNPAANAQAWGAYVEAHHGPLQGRKANYTHAFELNVTNFEADTPATLPTGVPAAGALGGTIGAGIAPENSGITYAVAHALRIVGLGAQFQAGIVFMQNALKAWGDGRFRAILLSRLHNISWFDTLGAGGTELMQIEVTSTGYNKGQKLAFGNLGMTLQNQAGHPTLFVNRGPDGATVDYLGLVATQGQGTRITTNGPGADIHLNLEPKGDGNVVIPLSSIRSYGSDAAAAAAGVPIGGLYRSGNAVMIRLT